MRAVLFDQPGGPEVLRVGEAPDPEPGPKDLLVRVRAAGLNRADLLQRLGRYPAPPGDSPLLGLELAGEVVSAGPEAHGPQGKRFVPGERVMALVGGGAYAELARVPAAQCLPLPENLSFVEGAAIPEVFLTAWLNLFRVGGLRQGEVAVVHAAGSGVGTAALQLARGVARVLLATASEGKLATCRALGATHTLPRSEVPGRLADAVREAAGGGADVILDAVGGSYLPANVAALGLHGRLLLISTAGGATATLDLSALLFKRLSLLGTTLRTRTAAQKASLIEEFAARALPRLASGQLRPIVAEVYPLAQVSTAHETLASDRVVGKIVLSLP